MVSIVFTLLQTHVLIMITDLAFSVTWGKISACASRQIEHSKLHYTPTYECICAVLALIIGKLCMLELNHVWACLLDSLVLFFRTWSVASKVTNDHGAMKADLQMLWVCNQWQEQSARFAEVLCCICWCRKQFMRHTTLYNCCVVKNYRSFRPLYNVESYRWY